MIWSDEAPTKPGFYWVRHARTSAYTPRVVKVYVKDGVLTVACPGAPRQASLHAWTNIPHVQWCRVPEPSEPSQDPYR